MSSADRWLLQVIATAFVPVMIVSGAVRRSTSAPSPARERGKLESPPNACLLNGKSRVAFASANFCFVRQGSWPQAVRHQAIPPSNSSGTTQPQEFLHGKT